ncbi:hypothetical protein BDV26DRAFT_271356 [Aspergillus bertholletiae]|uniref:Secreted protein n=1 Tax=Aspergillus bertholletiae TaxID=1226010 RepID=A0A5N7AV92_9EURO|nr:hypothetical protein BDV26DRAFT_271356 [Aspergillus bertholletiae]
MRHLALVLDIALLYILKPSGYTYILQSISRISSDLFCLYRFAQTVRLLTRLEREINVKLLSTYDRIDFLFYFS